MPFEPLTAVSSVDGRYRRVSEPLAEYFSEFALIKRRVRVECEYLVALSETPGVGMRTLSKSETSLVLAIAEITLDDARTVKKIEQEGHQGIPATNHDVKAVEYFVKEKMRGTSLADVVEWVHFALTSEDVNSVAYALQLRDYFEYCYLRGPLLKIHDALVVLSEEEADTAMLARTHGQSATPTTFGKEMRVFLNRLQRQVDTFKNTSVLVKWGGPSANYNAQMVAAPEVDWLLFARAYIERFNAEGVGKKHFMRLDLNEVTTQIEPHDTYAEYFDYMRRNNTILIDFSQDMWRYISDGWVKQKPKDGEVGSSAMPHKVNPIDFENAEGNLGAANALSEFFSRKLPISRLQRDLSDSPVVRLFGASCALAYIAQTSLVRGLGKIAIDREAMLHELEAHPEVLAEAIQTVLRREGVAAPYEKLKELTRGKTISLADIAAFIDTLEIEESVKIRLKALSPENYTGIAGILARGSV